MASIANIADVIHDLKSLQDHIQSKYWMSNGIIDFFYYNCISNIFLYFIRIEPKANNATEVIDTLYANTIREKDLETISTL